MLIGYRSSNHPQQVAKRGQNDDVDDRATTAQHFADFDERYGPFTLDVAAAKHNTKCERYFTIEDDGLAQSWAGERVWCNPPYSSIGPWVEKAWQERTHTDPVLRAERIVMLLPANRTEQRWWQDLVEPYRNQVGFEVIFLPGRIRFLKRGQSEIGPNERPPFGCCLLIWGGLWSGPTCFMCNGSGVYPYQPPGGVRWGRCAECHGHGREARAAAPGLHVTRVLSVS